MSLMMSSELAITPNQDKEVKDPDENIQITYRIHTISNNLHQWKQV